MVSWLPHVTSFLCCLGLEVGAKIVGFMHFIASTTYMILCAVSISQVMEVQRRDEIDEALYHSWFKIMVTMAAISVFHILLSLVLLYGTFKRKTKYIRCWVWLMGLLLIAGIAYVIITTVLYGFTGSGSDNFLTFLIGLITFSAIAYFILTVNSYYLLLKSSEDMEGPKNY